jgi:hypothetical protein
MHVRKSQSDCFYMSRLKTKENKSEIFHNHTLQVTLKNAVSLLLLALFPVVDSLTFFPRAKIFAWVS